MESARSSGRCERAWSPGRRRAIKTNRTPPNARRFRARLSLLLFFVFGSFTPFETRADAADGGPKIDLTFSREGDPETWLRPGVSMNQAFFTTKRAYGGNTRQNLGNDADGWYELGFEPSLDTQISLGEKGTIRGRLSGVWTTTQLGTDAAGSTLNESSETNTPSKLTLEDFYVGWNSGQLFADTLGEGAVDVSIGAQQYTAGPSGPTGDGLGHGLLFYQAGNDGKTRGGLWLGMRAAFQMTAIARLQTGGFDGEAVFLRSDELGNLNTEVVGTNLGYDLADCFEGLGLEFARVRAAYYRILDSDDARRDGLNVALLGLDVKPVPALEGLRLTGEYVYEKNGSENDSWAAWGELGYDFQDVPWKPYVSYRYAFFSGDDGSGTNNNFDSLFWGFSDWNYWYIGEISGEYLSSNSNLQSHITRIRTSPTDELTLHFFHIYQRLDNLQAPGSGLTPRPPLDPRDGTFTSKDLWHEIDFIADYRFNHHLVVSAVAAYLFPLSGGEDVFGDDDTWQNYMLWARVNF